jgi:hypothetical protein
MQFQGWYETRPAVVRGLAEAAEQHNRDMED